MQSDENRIAKIQHDAACAGGEIERAYTQTMALCEIARQLSRIADAYEEAHK